jgi:hypothetical protein
MFFTDWPVEDVRGLLVAAGVFLAVLIVFAVGLSLLVRRSGL